MSDDAEIRAAVLKTLGQGGTYDVRQLLREARALRGVPMEAVLEAVRELVREHRVMEIRPWKSSTLDHDATGILTMFAMR